MIVLAFVLSIQLCTQCLFPPQPPPHAPTLGYPKIVNKGSQTRGLPFLSQQQLLLSLHIFSPCAPFLLTLLQPSCLCVKHSWRLWFPILTVSRKRRKLPGNLCLKITGGVINKTSRDRSVLGNTDKIRGEEEAKQFTCCREQRCHFETGSNKASCI